MVKPLCEIHPEFGRRESVEIHGDGFELRVFVRRPPEVEALIDALSHERLPDNGLTPREREQAVLWDPCRKLMAAVRLQAVRLDPRTVERAEVVRVKFETVFRAAGLGPIYMEAIPNEYCGKDSSIGLDDPWFLVTSRLGHIKIGWRKRVINIDWSRTGIEQDAEVLFPAEDVSRGHGYIHAYGYEKATAYLSRLAEVSPDGE